MNLSKNIIAEDAAEASSAFLRRAYHGGENPVWQIPWSRTDWRG